MIWVIVMLIFIGLVFLVLEILVFPGQAIAGVIGLVLLVIGIWETYIALGPVVGHWVLAGTLVASVALLVFALRSKTWTRLSLKEDIDSKVNLVPESKIKIGDIGKTISRLNPAGKALFGDEYFEVHSYGEFINPGIEIVVNKINFNKIYVKQKSN
jgi:membrane-bound ClpP family serine protease